MKSLIPQLCWGENGIVGNDKDKKEKPPCDILRMVSQAKLNTGGGPNGQ